MGFTGFGSVCTSGDGPGLQNQDTAALTSAAPIDSDDATRVLASCLALLATKSPDLARSSSSRGMGFRTRCGPESWRWYEHPRSERQNTAYSCNIRSCKPAGTAAPDQSRSSAKVVRNFAFTSAVRPRLLVECAWCMLRYNAWAKATWMRLTHGGKTHRKQAIVALARKLLVRCWAMLRDGTPWRSTPSATPRRHERRELRSAASLDRRSSVRRGRGSRGRLKPKETVASARSFCDPERGAILSREDVRNEGATRRIWIAGPAFSRPNRRAVRKRRLSSNNRVHSHGVKSLAGAAATA